MNKPPHLLASAPPRQPMNLTNYPINNDVSILMLNNGFHDSESQRQGAKNTGEITRNRIIPAPSFTSDEFVEDMEDVRERDHEPLIIRGPTRQGRIHQFLSTVKLGVVPGSAAAAGSNNNNPKNVGEPSNGAGRNNETTGSASTTNQPCPYNESTSSTPEHLIGAAIIRSGRLPLDHPSSKCSLGILLAAVSCIFFATTSLIVKVSSIHPMQLLAARGLFQGLCVVPIVISTKSSLVGTKGTRPLLLARGILGSAALIMSFISIHLIPLADSSTVIFTSPVFVSIFACLCLGEICTWFDMLMITLTLLGVIFVSKPSFHFLSSGSSWDSVVGTFCGLAAAMFTALAFIVLRQLKQVHYSVTVLWFSIILTFFGSVLTIALDAFTFPNDWLNMIECLGVGICGFLGQVLLTKALQMETATTVAIARTLDIVFAFVFQIVLLHDTPDIFSCFGSVLVISCVVLTACRRRYAEVQVKKSNSTNNNIITGPVVQLDHDDVS